MFPYDIDGLTGAEHEEFFGPDWHEDEDDDYDFEYSPDCPACLRHLDHTRQEHEQALARNYRNSLP